MYKTKKRSVIRSMVCPPLRLDLIDKICCILELKALKMEGIFRISGNSDEIRLMLTTFNKKLDDIPLNCQDLNDITGVLKLYLREQTVPLVPYEISEQIVLFLEKGKASDEEKLNRIIDFVNEIPLENKPIFRRILVLLSHVIQNESENKMTPSNIGIVFGPTLFKFRDGDELRLLKLTQFQALAITIIIKNIEKILRILPKGESSYRIFQAPEPLSEDDWELLLSNSSILTLEKNDVLLQEGQPNYNLFRVKKGQLQIEKNKRVVNKISTGTLLGEMSFLGRFDASATVVCDQKAELQVIQYCYLTSVLCAQKALLMKFYWNMAHGLAKRLLNFHNKYDHNIIPVVADDLRSQTEILRIFSKDGSSNMFVADANENIRQFINRIARKLQKEDASLFNLWQSRNEKDYSQIPDEETIDILIIRISENPNMKLVLSDVEPTEQPPEVTDHIQKDIILKEYLCRYKGKHGKLQVLSKYLQFHSKTLGFEKKTSIFFSNVLSILQDPSASEIVVECKNNQKRAFSFKALDQMMEAYSLIEGIYQQNRNLNASFSIGREAGASLSNSMANSIESAKSPRATALHRDLFRQSITLPSNFDSQSDMSGLLSHTISSPDISLPKPGLPKRPLMFIVGDKSKSRIMKQNNLISRHKSLMIESLPVLTGGEDLQEDNTSVSHSLVTESLDFPTDGDSNQDSSPSIVQVKSESNGWGPRPIPPPRQPPKPMAAPLAPRGKLNPPLHKSYTRMPAPEKPSRVSGESSKNFSNLIAQLSVGSVAPPTSLSLTSLPDPISKTDSSLSSLISPRKRRPTTDKLPFRRSFHIERTNGFGDQNEEDSDPLSVLETSRAIVTKVFSATSPDHLTLNINDVVIIYHRHDKIRDIISPRFGQTNWLEGELNGRRGIFPPDHVELIEETSSMEKLKGSGYRNLSDLPTTTDWKLILMGGKTLTFSKNQVILSEGDRLQRIYQINQGSCRTESLCEDGTTRILGTMDTDTTFGEVSFLMGEGASATVLADEDDVEIYVIEAEYLKRLFDGDHLLAARFYKYLATVLEGRLRKLEGS